MSATKTVLYVEDEPLIRELSVLSLEYAGFEVVIAVNGRAALNALAKLAKPFSALITDINLGRGPDGWEVAKRAREVNGALPVIYVTGAGGHDWQAKGVPDSVMIESRSILTNWLLRWDHCWDASSPLCRRARNIQPG